VRALSNATHKIRAAEAAVDPRLAEAELTPGP
jgi:hypothetical protein